ncbi:hypothetical protein U1Q18_047527 [Sarracenia purpurea var. burkii]
MNSAYSGISKSYSLVHASAPKNYRTMFRQTIIYYENNIIKANNTYLREQFPDMDESFLAWHEEFKKGPATYATEVLQSFGLWYDPDLNDIVEITEKRPVKSETWKTLDDRRLLLWVSFFQGIMKITPRPSYNEDLMKYETSLETNNALKLDGDAVPLKMSGYTISSQIRFSSLLWVASRRSNDCHHDLCIELMRWFTPYPISSWSFAFG